MEKVGLVNVVYSVFLCLSLNIGAAREEESWPMAASPPRWKWSFWDWTTRFTCSQISCCASKGKCGARSELICVPIYACEDYIKWEIYDSLISRILVQNVSCIWEVSFLSNTVKRKPNSYGWQIIWGYNFCSGHCYCSETHFYIMSNCWENTHMFHFGRRGQLAYFVPKHQMLTSLICLARLNHKIQNVIL